MAAVTLPTYAPPPAEPTWWERRAFRDAARDAMSARLGVPLVAGTASATPSSFDLATRDGHVVGDVHAITLYNGRSVAARAWLLSEAPAHARFVVFGRDARLAREWMRRHAHHFPGIDFYFLAAPGDLRRLPTIEAGRSFHP